MVMVILFNIDFVVYDGVVVVGGVVVVCEFVQYFESFNFVVGFYCYVKFIGSFGEGVEIVIGLGIGNVLCCVVVDFFVKDGVMVLVQNFFEVVGVCFVVGEGGVKFVVFGVIVGQDKGVSVVVDSFVQVFVEYCFWGCLQF